MPVFDTYTQGTPNWVELVTPDQRAAAEFYGDAVRLADGRAHAAATARSTSSPASRATPSPASAVRSRSSPGHPAFWNVYLAADDVDDVASRVGPAGGEVEAAPFDFFDLGRTARIKDPTGARVNLWQGRSHLGTARASEPGTPIWNELLTPDVGRATRFYSDVFGLSAEESPVAWGSVTSYTTLSSAGRPDRGRRRAPRGCTAALERLLQRRRRRRVRGAGRRLGRQADRPAVRPRRHRPDGHAHRPPGRAVLPHGVRVGR